MKKNLLTILFIMILSFFIKMNGVEAQQTYWRSMDDVKNGNSVIVCDYVSDDARSRVRLIYDFVKIDEKKKKDFWSIHYGFDRDFVDDITDDFSDAKGTNFGGPVNGLFDTSAVFNAVFINGHVSFNKSGNYLSEQKDFYCTDYLSVKHGFGNEICFTDNELGCGSTYDYGVFKLTNSKNGAVFHSLFFVINDFYKQAEEEVLSDLTADTLNGKEMEKIKIKVKSYVSERYQFSTVYNMPDFVKNYIENIENHVDISNITTKIEEIESDLNEKLANNEISQEEYDRQMEKVNTSKKNVEDLYKSSINDIPDLDTFDCESILTDDIVNLLSDLMTFIQYLGPILVILLTIVDFVKAAISGEQDAINKSAKKFTKRIVAAILLFFLPLLVNIIIGFVDTNIPPVCIK